MKLTRRGAVVGMIASAIQLPKIPAKTKLGPCLALADGARVWYLGTHEERLVSWDDGNLLRNWVLA